MEGGLRNVYISFVFIASGGLLFGYIIGLNSNVITTGQLLCPDDWSGPVGTITSVGYNQCYQLSSLAVGFFSSLNLIGATITSLVCFRFADDLGRKLEVQIGSALYLTGACVAAFSPVLWGIYMGFAIYGLGIGFAMHAAPVFIAEISPANVRGTLVSAKEAVVVLGIFLGFFFGYLFSGVDTYGWRFGTAISAVFALIMGVGIIFIPQSPRFLVLKAIRNGTLLGVQQSQMDAARSALKFFRGAAENEEIDTELNTMYEEISSSVGAEVAKVGDAFKYPRPLLIGCGIVFLQQVTGQPSVLYFATDIFKSAGFGTNASLSSVSIGLVKLIATLFTVWRVDQYGRRVLLFAGIGLMSLALAILGVAFLYQRCSVAGVSIGDCADSDKELPREWGAATVVALMLYVSGYQVGFGPIAWLLISEVFPLKVRGAALSLAAIVNFSGNITMTLTAKVLQEALSMSGVFFGYFAISLLSILFVHGVIPETKGKTLEEIEKELTGKPSDLARSVSLSGTNAA
jgi:sugar porter (SP) family MFS transporter